jgi:hypothetical protein
LLQLQDTFSGEHVTCVELVARSYLRAGLPLQVRLEASGKVDFEIVWAGIKDMRARAPSHALAQALQSTSQHGDDVRVLEEQVRWAADASTQIRSVLEEGSPAREKAVAVLKHLVLPVSERLDEPDTRYVGLVTPAQLQHSPNLRLLGRLT